jgi:iron complex outermembrane receptor protein
MTMLAYFLAWRVRPWAYGLVTLVALTTFATSSPLLEAQEAVRVSGVVVDRSGEPVAAATVQLGERAETRTDRQGRFEIAAAPGATTLAVRHVGYLEFIDTIHVVVGIAELRVLLESTVTVGETVSVVGIRASDDTPVTTAELSRAELDKISYGQDVPQVLQYTPSATWYSDSGIGTNYSYFSLRGLQQTRINLTYDGAPLNDPAEHALYFNNFHDFLNEVDSVQVQRGVGTSTVGSPAYGGSVNFASRAPEMRPGLSGRVQFGSYDTTRISLGGQTGRFGDGFWATGRYSFSDTDGYRDNSGSRHNNLFLSGGWEGERASLKFTGFMGSAQSQLAWLAVDPATLEQNRRFNPLDEEERDNFGQDFAQLRYMRDLGNDWIVSGSVYYNGADGWFRLWDSPAQSRLLQFGVDQGFWGGMATATRTGNRLTASLGAHYNDFSGDHTLDNAGARIYANTGHKKTANLFAKAEYGVGDWILFGDLQFRWAEFAYTGDVDLGSVSWSFLDPKVGARYMLSSVSSIYASVGRAQREPARLDLLAGEDNASVPHDLTAVRPESVVNVEVGFNLRTNRVALQTSLYAMEFRDEIALTGELSDIGLPVRTNVDQSYRRGLEVDLRWRLGRSWTLLHSLNLSSNRIADWTQHYDVYDPHGAWIGSTPIGLNGRTRA